MILIVINAKPSHSVKKGMHDLKIKGLSQSYFKKSLSVNYCITNFEFSL